MSYPPTPATRLPGEDEGVEPEARTVESEAPTIEPEVQTVERREFPSVEPSIRGFLVALALLAPLLWLAFVVPLEATLLVAAWAGTFGLLVVGPLLVLGVVRRLLDR